MADIKNILSEIVADKRKEVDRRKSLYPTKLLEESTYFPTRSISMVKYLKREDKHGIIAEFKRKSPSKGFINQYASIERTSIGYMQAGASGLSVLTDEPYFAGKNQDLTDARNFNFCPILRKDFIVDEYQIVEAKSIGADVILLIASVLNVEETKNLAQLAKSLGLEVLLEVHDKSEADMHPNEYVDMVGVNNRNLVTFETTIETSKELADKIPSEFTKVTESGISQPNAVVELMKYGYQGFLIGEYFMKHARPEKACEKFIGNLAELLKK